MFHDSFRFLLVDYLKYVCVSIQSTIMNGIQYGDADEICVRYLALQLNILNWKDVKLYRIIMKVKNRIHIVGLGLGEDTKHVEQYYPHAKGSISIQDLSRQIGSVLQKILRRH